MLSRIALLLSLPALTPPVFAHNPHFLDAASFQEGSKAYQYFVRSLPNVNFDFPQSWAGQIPVRGTRNDELFFWFFEAESKPAAQNLIIWLNGGPGCSSLNGLTKENGPIYFPDNSTSPQSNPNSWTKLANLVYVDQPVGAGFSDGEDQVTTNAQVTQEFLAVLQDFYTIFPVLKPINTFILGESYSGIYVPYISQALIDKKNNLQVNLKAIAIGDGTWGNSAALTDVVTTAYLNRHNDVLRIPNDILDTFNKADQTCGFDKVLQQATYPRQAPIVIPGNPEGENYRLKKRQEACNSNSTPQQVAESIENCNGGCATWTLLLAYLGAVKSCFSPYNIYYGCDNTPDIGNYIAYLQSPAVRAAIHAPNKTFQDCNRTIFNTLIQEQVEPPAYRIMPEILKAGIKIHLYSGNDDLFANHLGTELGIQNMTWNGCQGFECVPNNPFVVRGQNMGNWGYERGLSYHRILKAGHAVPHDNPVAAFTFVKDYVIGDVGHHNAGKCVTGNLSSVAE